MGNPVSFQETKDTEKSFPNFHEQPSKIEPFQWYKYTNLKCV